ncbi:hypothetical protein HQ584_03175 [Patescibacteria group bacterium]|nr:hypothetical protein [Patescibacteria group bacterium]
MNNKTRLSITEAILRLKEKGPHNPKHEGKSLLHWHCCRPMEKFSNPAYLVRTTDIYVCLYCGYAKIVMYLPRLYKFEPKQIKVVNLSKAVNEA